ncbi:hypothetical protein [Streptomyces anulatus]|uniref:hypothetical protein n=1 Tax=Streptomyces anulatus TaxID=1892 RepID=UPI0036B66B79
MATDSIEEVVRSGGTELPRWPANSPSAALPAAWTWTDGEEPVAVNSELDPRTVLMMFPGAFVVYVALEHPQFGTALLVGVGVVTLLHLLTKGN